MAPAFFKMSRSFCVLSNSRLSRRSSSRFRRLMPTAWKRFRTMLGQLLAKFPDRRVRDAQFASHLCNRLPAGLSEPYGFALQLLRLGLLAFLHDPCLSSGILSSFTPPRKWVKV